MKNEWQAHACVFDAKMQMENDDHQVKLNEKNIDPKDNGKFYGWFSNALVYLCVCDWEIFTETLFLGAMAGFGLLIGFSSGISVAKKNDETAFAKVFESIFFEQI